MYDFIGLADLKHAFRGQHQFPDRFGFREELYALVEDNDDYLIYQCKRKPDRFVSMSINFVDGQWKFQDAIDMDLRKIYCKEV